MNDKKLPQPGTYRLTQDVVNPSPDRRKRHDWRDFPVWKKGSVIRIDTWMKGEVVQGHQLQDTMEMTMQGSHSCYHAESWNRDGAFWLLIPHLEPLEETVSDMLIRKGSHLSAPAILDYFAEQGAITKEQVEKALETLHKRWSDEEKGA